MSDLVAVKLALMAGVCGVYAGGESARFRWTKGRWPAPHRFLARAIDAATWTDVRRFLAWFAPLPDSPTDAVRRLGGLILAPALLIRAGLHAIPVVAASDDAPPDGADAELAVRNQMTDDPVLDIAGRCLCLGAVGVFLAGGVPTFVTTTLWERLGVLYLGANVAVFVADLPAGIALQTFDYLKQ